MADSPYRVLGHLHDNDGRGEELQRDSGLPCPFGRIRGKMIFEADNDIVLTGDRPDSSQELSFWSLRGIRATNCSSVWQSSTPHLLSQTP